MWLPCGPFLAQWPINVLTPSRRAPSTDRVMRSEKRGGRRQERPRRSASEERLLRFLRTEGERRRAARNLIREEAVVPTADPTNPPFEFSDEDDLPGQK